MAQRLTSLSDLLREDYLSCKICYELYRTPKLLPCLHTYCESCLDQIAMDGFLDCPECRIKVTLDNGVKSLKNNFFINSLLEVLQPRQGKDLECSVCATAQKHVPAASRCLDCCDFLCQTCAVGHGCSRATLSHKVVDLEEFLVGLHDVEVRSRQEMFCTEHEQEPLRFFCDTCNVPICRDCRLLAHFQHHVVSMADAIKKKRPEVNKLLEGLEGNICKISQWKEEVTGSLALLSRARETIKESITSYIEEAIALLHIQKEAAFTELDHFLDKETSELLVVKGELHSQWDWAVTTREFSQKVMDIGNDSEILSMEEAMRQRMQELQSFTQKKQDPKIPQLVLGGKDILPHVQFFKLVDPEEMSKNESQIPQCSSPAVSSLVGGEATVGSNSQASQSSESELKTLQPKDCQPPPSQYNPAQPRGCVILHLVNSFGLQQDDDAFDSKITGIAAFPGNGGILVVDNGNNEIKRFSPNGDLRRIIRLVDSDLDLCGITVCGNTLACSADNYLYFLTLGGNFLHKMKLRSLQDNPQYAIASYGSQYVAVSEGTLCSVSLYNTNGQCLERIKPQGYQGTKFLFIAVNSNEEFIVCDVANHEIVIFERSGDLIHIIDASNSPLSRPFSLCLNSKDQIFVIDEERVIQFSNDGKDGQTVLFTSFGESKPRMIVIDSNGCLVLVHRDNEVKIYVQVEAGIVYQGT